MAWWDLRSFLAALEERGDLVRIGRTVDWEYEAAALARQTSDCDGPALLYESMRDSALPCLTGLFAARRRVAWAMDVDEDDLATAYRERESKHIEPRLVEGPAPCQEIVISGDQVDVFSLPIVRHFELDAGRYVTGGLQIAKDPGTGIRNVSIHRMLPLGKNLLTVFAPEGRQLRTIIERHHDLGRGCEISTAIGVEPATQIASQARMPYGVDEFRVAGALRGEPLEIVRGISIDVEVPATSEIVIEGRTIPGRYEIDGPFGEYPGTYSDGKLAPVVEVTAITMRRSAIYQNILTGMPMTENHWMMQPAVTALAYHEAYKITPEVRAVNVTPAGTARHHVVVAIKKRQNSEARNLALALLAAPIGAKLVTVVDEDIDVFDPFQVEWAVNTRMQADRDVMIVSDFYSPTLDPSAPAPRTSAKMGIDATMPINERAKFSPARILGIEDVSLKAELDRMGWKRPASTRLREAGG